MKNAFVPVLMSVFLSALISCSPSDSAPLEKTTSEEVFEMEEVPMEKEEKEEKEMPVVDSVSEAVGDEITTPAEPAEMDSLRRKILDRLLQEKTMNRGLDTSK
ncbi:MAG: hypothetical protein EP346_07220 [Bacteroidetes bacterium]|nr:MAG: hypothetical protein EP346_07220 [Bacteroidota bacterium]